jgi:hypothetical protein
VKALAYWNEGAHAFVVENDSVKISVGGSSDRLPLQTTIQVIQ